MEKINDLNFMPMRSKPVKKYQRGKTNINSYNRKKRKLIFFALGLAIGVIGAKGIDEAINWYNKQEIISNTLKEYSQIVSENSYIIRNDDGTPKIVNGSVLTAIDTNGIADVITQKIEDGENERGVIYGFYENMNSPYEIDDFRSSLGAAGISPENWLEENGYIDYEDPNLKEDAEGIYIAEYNYDKEMGNILGGK